MPVSTENIRRWIEQSDIDYVTYFIKAWIPFNAWYNAAYETLEGDRAKINAIKRTASDPVRKGINSYLEGEGQHSQSFKSYLSGLHHALEEATLTSREGKISFREIIKEANPNNLVNNETKKRITYYLKRTDGNRLSEVAEMLVILKDSQGQAIFNYRHTDYDLIHLQHCTSPNFRALSDSQQENTRIFFESLHPVIITDAIESELRESPRNYYRCDSYHFKRDANDSYCQGHIVARALIEVLYQLRNILFHGELIPHANIQPVYHHAYLLLKLLLEKIR